MLIHGAYFPDVDPDFNPDLNIDESIPARQTTAYNENVGTTGFREMGSLRKRLRSFGAGSAHQTQHRGL
jgi:hypothetical protein